MAPRLPNWRKAVAPALRLGLALGCALLLVGARGWLMARLQGGRYPPTAAVLDSAALLALAGVVFLVSKAIYFAVERLLRPRSKRARVAAAALRIIVVLLFTGPIVFAGAQLHPQRVLPRSTPASVGMHYESVSFNGDGHQLAGWWIRTNKPDQPVVVVAHGIGANKEQALYPAMLLHQRGFNVLLFDFRAHGESDGFLSTLGEREALDVRAAHEWVARTMPGAPIYAIGYSMGGSAVARAAADFGIFDKVVLDSTYARVENVAHAKFLRFTGPLAPLFWQELRLWGGVLTFTDVGAHQPEDVVAKVAGKPLLLIHGTEDRTIPFHEMERLKAKVGASADVWLVAGADHIEAMTREEYGDRVASFLRAPVRDLPTR